MFRTKYGSMMHHTVLPTSKHHVANRVESGVELLNLFR